MKRQTRTLKRVDQPAAARKIARSSITHIAKAAVFNLDVPERFLRAEQGGERDLERGRMDPDERRRARAKSRITLPKVKFLTE